MTTRKRHTPEQVVRKLVEADRLLAGGADTTEVARQLGVSEQTYFRWRNQFGGLKAEDAKELKKLRAENQRLKRLLADAELDKDMLREVACRRPRKTARRRPRICPLAVMRTAH